MSETKNPVVHDIPGILKGMDEQEGQPSVLHADLDYDGAASSTHNQGYALYNGYHVITHNKTEDKRKGFFIACDPEDERNTFTCESADDGFEHLGGCQRIGDYLLVAVETHRTDPRQSHIRLYDLTQLSGKTVPLVKDFDIYRKENGAAAAGITYVNDRYLLAAYEGSYVDFYQSDSDVLIGGYTKKATYKFSKNMEYSNVCLLTGDSGKVYAVFFKSDDSWDDYADLYEIDTEKFTLSWVKEKDRVHLICKPGGTLGVHCRYAAGIDIVSENNFHVYVAARNFESKKLDINSFA